MYFNGSHTFLYEFIVSLTNHLIERQKRNY